MMLIISFFFFYAWAWASSFSPLAMASSMVPLNETIRGFKMILDGEVDDLPEQAFLNVGTIDDAIAKGKKLLEQVG